MGAPSSITKGRFGSSRESELLRLAAFPVPNAQQQSEVVGLLDGRSDFIASRKAAPSEAMVLLISV